MGGFCGIMQENSPVDRVLLTEMREKMYHRGPDEGNNFIDGKIGLGFRQLKVANSFTGGDSQPLSNENGSLFLVCDGRIYNHAILREELIRKGHKFSSQRNCEVVLHLYEEKGVECLPFLRGMFAFVLWDKKRQRLFGARDRFGIKPFYYIKKPDCLAFASEIKALAVLPFFSREIGEDAFSDYLTFQYVPEPRTMFADVFRLPPAHYFLKLFGKPLEINRYWQIQFNPSPAPLEHFAEKIRKKVREAVQLHLADNLPRGAFLSSGIDSAILAALAREQKPIFTFSVGYNEEKYSELKEARETAKFLETEHHEYVITPREFLELLPKLVWHFDEPVADPAAIALFFAARLARLKTSAVLSGEGADEVFAGYSIYREPFSLAPVCNLPQPLRRPLYLLEKLLPSGTPGKNYLARTRRPLEKRFLGNAYIFSPSEKEKISSLNSNPSPFRITAPLYRQSLDYDDPTRMQYIDLNTWMPGDILLKADKMSMANSLELRTPYLDHHVFELASTLPLEYKINGKTTKKALREDFRGTLPPFAIDRPKRGFPVPTREWVKRPDFRNLLLDLLSGEGGSWFHKNNVKKMLGRHLEGKIEASRKLWTILIFLLWHEVFCLKKPDIPRLKLCNSKNRQ